MKKNQKIPKKQFLDLPYDCLGEIFYFYLEDVYDFFTMFLVSQELSNLVCFYADNVEFVMHNIPSEILSKNENLSIEPNFKSRIYLAVKILKVKLKSVRDDELIKSIKIFKNIKRISFIIDDSSFGDELLKSFASTSLESFVANRSLFSHIINSKISITGLGLSFLPNTVTELNISGCKKIDDFRFLLRLLKLKKVDVRGTNITDKDMFHFPKFLLEVNVGDCDITREGFKTLFKDSVIEKLVASGTGICNDSLSILPKTLKELDIRRCKNISDEGIKHLSRTNIKKLIIYSCNKITKEGFSYLPEFIEELDSSMITSDECLKEISKFKIKNLECGFKFGGFISEHTITNKGLSYFPSTLKVLDLSYCDSFDSLDYIKNFDFIEVLIISDCENLDNEGIKNLGKFKNLKKLNFRYCFKLNEEGLKFIPNTLKDLDIYGLNKIKTLKFLSKLKNLKKLDIGDIGFDDENLKYIPQTVSLLNLSYNKKLTDEGLKKLQCLENLTYLNLSECDITNNGVYYIIKKSARLKGFLVRLCDKVNLTKMQIRKKNFRVRFFS